MLQKMILLFRFLTTDVLTAKYADPEVTEYRLMMKPSIGPEILSR